MSTAATGAKTVVAGKSEVGKAEVKKEVAKTVAAEATAKKEKRTKVQASPPPPPPMKLGEFNNPIVESKSNKRALTVAIVEVCTVNGVLDEAKACLMIRASGIPYKAGYQKDVPTDTLSSNEWSGKSYVRFRTHTSPGKVYHTKFPERVEKCMPFAKELKKVVDEELKKHSTEAKKDTSEKKETPKETAKA